MTSQSTPNDAKMQEISLTSRPARATPTTISATTGGNIPDEDDDDYTSSSGSDSSDEDSGDDNNQNEKKAAPTHNKHEGKSDDGLDHDHGLPQIPARHKPRIHRIEQDTDLFSRLSAFLPKMKTANEELERDIQAGRAQDVQIDVVEGGDEDDEESDEEHDGKQYIEMNLGLGVLEEKRQNSAEESNDIPAAGNSESSKDSNVLGKLMGQEKNATSPGKPTIEEMKD